MPQLNNGATPYVQLLAITSPPGHFRVFSFCDRFVLPWTLLHDVWRPFPSGHSRDLPLGYNILRALGDCSIDHVLGPVSAMEISTVLFHFACTGCPQAVHLACLTDQIIRQIHTTLAGQVPLELMDCTICVALLIRSVLNHLMIRAQPEVFPFHMFPTLNNKGDITLMRALLLQQSFCAFYSQNWCCTTKKSIHRSDLSTSGLKGSHWMM